MPEHSRALLAAGLLLAFAACADGGGANDAGREDSSVEDAGSEDANVADAGGEDGGFADGGSDGGWLDGGTSDWGFATRIPLAHTVPCESTLFCGGPTSDASDRDFVCTLKWGSWDHVIYVQSTPLRYVDIIGFEYETVGAWISDGTTVSEIDASYDWGGNHHNESILIDLAEQRFHYWHSSFGFGFRACQPPDCVEVYEPGTSTLVEDGCAPARTIPTVCVQVGLDGAVPPLIDMFEKCPGDT